MNIVIVSREDTSPILAYLATALSQATGWRVATHPDSEADLNYFFPYLEWDGTWHETPVACLFSHKEQGRPEKEALWQIAAERCDLRTAWAGQYVAELSKYGPAVQVTPPLDREKFSPVPRSRGSPPVVGVSGFTCPGGRKGEGLVLELVGSELGKRLNVVASGSGWPCPTTLYEWAHLEKFYQGLDAYLCTATVEGVPYPPLEALACGVPVVIPRGVGLLDELPDLENLHRYTAGNFAEMCTALQAALTPVSTKGTNIASLRGATARFTFAAWEQDHRQAFRDLLYGPAQSAPLPDWRGKCGFYVVAYGDPARGCAERLLRSIRRHMPGVPVALVSDKPLGLGEAFIERADTDIGGRGAKLEVYDRAPAAWELVIYLDADTELTADVSFLFQVLADGWDAFWCLNPTRYALVQEMSRPDNQKETDETLKLLGTGHLLQLNGGVFGFRRNARTKEFFGAWLREWGRYAQRDQGALTRTLHNHPLRVYTLGVEFNCSDRYVSAERSAGIVHHQLTARRWKGLINGRLDSSEAWAAWHPTGEVQK